MFHPEAFCIKYDCPVPTAVWYHKASAASYNTRSTLLRTGEALKLKYNTTTPHRKSHYTFFFFFLTYKLNIPQRLADTETWAETLFLPIRILLHVCMAQQRKFIGEERLSHHYHRRSSPLDTPLSSLWKQRVTNSLNVPVDSRPSSWNLSCCYFFPFFPLWRSSAALTWKKTQKKFNVSLMFILRHRQTLITCSHEQIINLLSVQSITSIHLWLFTVSTENTSSSPALEGNTLCP